MIGGIRTRTSFCGFLRLSLYSSIVKLPPNFKTSFLGEHFILSSWSGYNYE